MKKNLEKKLVEKIENTRSYKQNIDATCLSGSIKSLGALNPFTGYALISKKSESYLRILKNYNFFDSL